MARKEELEFGAVVVCAVRPVEQRLAASMFIAAGNAAPTNRVLMPVAVRSCVRVASMMVDGGKPGWCRNEARGAQYCLPFMLNQRRRVELFESISARVSHARLGA